MKGIKSNVYNCENCRFHDHTNRCCRYCVTEEQINFLTGKTELRKPSEWLPLTEAQQLERELSNERSVGRLHGNFDTGYSYELTKKEIEYMKNDVKVTATAYNKMYKNKSPKQKALERIKQVIFNDPCTIVFWNDGTKTVVKCGEDEVFDPEKGLAMAISKYFFDNKGYFNDVFKKFVQEEKDEFDELPKSLKETIDKAIHKDPEPSKTSATQIKESLKNTPNTQKGLYSVKELADLCECSEASILKDIKKGKFPGAKKEHGKWVIPYEF